MRSLLQNPEVLGAIIPTHAIRFFAANGMHGFLVLGSVFLVVTGGEALYADMGHFGRSPIRLAWFGIVQPGLMLNYFGQGALLLRNPQAAEQPFYLLSPPALLLPLVVLATIAAVIASQALISAVFSLTRQAVQLGYSPRLEIQHTSATTMGQIYIKKINWALMFATIGLVLAFESSSNLAAAYGIAVTATMGITTILAYVITRHVWGWARWSALLVTIPLFGIDLAFFSANALKIAHGGWVPLLIASLIYLLMSTWKRGRQILGDAVARACVSVRPVPEGHPREAARARSRHGRVHDGKRRRHASDADAQPRAQQSAAHADRPADRHDRRRADRAARGSGARRAAR